MCSSTRCWRGSIEHLKKKDKPFRVIDAHAGVGAYALDGIEAGKTLEWQGGIGKMAHAFAPEIEALLRPYREVVAALNPAGELRRYPGSPEVVARLMRQQDRLIANELHPDDNIALERHFLRDRQRDGDDARCRGLRESQSAAAGAARPRPHRSVL